MTVATLFDYGAGNLHSLAKALVAAGARVEVTTDAGALARAGLVVLPGVGAFGAAVARLSAARASLAAALAAGTPCLGICLGMQLLFDGSDEGPGPGLGLLTGRVTRLAAPRVPHLGWNTLTGDEPLLARARLDTAYHAHSFACRPRDPGVVTAWCTHGTDRFPAVVRTARTVGVQFHPEKSSAPGIAFLRAFLAEAACA
jgi:glutamine amidotransferase